MHNLGGGCRSRVTVKLQFMYTTPEEAEAALEREVESFSPPRPNDVRLLADINNYL